MVKELRKKAESDPLGRTSARTTIIRGLRVATISEGSRTLKCAVRRVGLESASERCSNGTRQGALTCSGQGTPASSTATDGGTRRATPFYEPLSLARPVVL